MLIFFLILKKYLSTYSETCVFSKIQCVDFQQQPVGGALKVLAKSLETVFGEVYFSVNLHRFFLPPSLLRQTFPQGKSFVSFQAQ